jgi:DhnA family fructose-bisphosphate aldolase class Ia
VSPLTPDRSPSADRWFESAVAAGKRRRARRLFGADGRTVLVALDHAAYMAAGPPAAAVSACALAAPDGVLATWHTARAHAAELAAVGLVLRIDGGVSDLGQPGGEDVSDVLYRAEQAIAIGADAVVLLAYPGAADEHRSLQRLARVCAECELLGLPVMAEMIPGGWGRAVEWSVENVCAGARIGVELGADIIKTVCPGAPGEFAAVVEACPAPVVALGGPKLASEDDVVGLAGGVVEAGAAGVAFGRNVWGAADPAKLIARLHDAVHAA